MATKKTDQHSESASRAVATSLGTRSKANKNNDLEGVQHRSSVRLGTTPDLFHVEKQIQFDDVEMGVLESGVPYLTSRGLARMIGIDHGPFHRLTANWAEESLKPRGREISKLLEDYGYFEDALYLKAEFKGQEINAFTESVCLSLLEYYAFIADEPRPEALKAFRTLARVKFREFVYDAVGYRPEQKALDSWKHFHDRVDMTATAVPDGYFGVFHEVASMIVPMIRAGVIISDKVVPDISVGKAWSSHWADMGYEATLGQRRKYDHAYPDYYPQSKSNPQPSFAYPNTALGHFRDWLKNTYLVSKLPAYVLGQSKKGALPDATAKKVIETFTPAALPPPKTTKKS